MPPFTHNVLTLPQSSLAILIDGLRSDSLATRVASASSLDKISSGLGVDRTIDELIPFLADSIDDDDTVLLAIATVLPKLVDLLPAHHRPVLLKPLELLLTVEESSVRQAAAASLIIILPTFPKQALVQELPPLILRLGHSSFFTSRLSAADLLPVLVQHLTDSKSTTDEAVDASAPADAAAPDPDLQAAKELYEALARDDTPMVRRAAYTVLPALLKSITTSNDDTLTTLTDTLLPLFTSLAVDGQDSVRLITPATTVAVINLLPHPYSITATTVVTQRLLPTYLAAAADRSWRVRWSCAVNFATLLAAITPKDGSGTDSAVFFKLRQAYTTLLHDPEPEVRSAAIAVLPVLCESVSRSDDKATPDSTTGELPPSPVAALALSLLPSLPQLTSDAHAHVRAALAAVLPLLAPPLGAAQTQSHLLPLLLPLLRDPDSAVRLALLSNLKAINEVVGADTLAQAVLPAVVELAEDTKWRVRQAVIEEVRTAR